MVPKFWIFSIVCAFLFVENAVSHSYHLGGCPNIEPMQDFSMEKMLGIWYVIEKTSTASSCIIYNITKTEEPNEYKIEEISQHFLLALTPIKHGYHYTGNLKVVDDAIPARMTVKFPLSVAGQASFTIFSTDYVNYAGIFTCQKLTFANRQSATILSRSKTLDKMYLEKVRSKLSIARVDPFDLSIISQKDCPKNLTEGYNININDETISAKAAAEVIRKTGQKIGDGVEYVVEKTKQVYHKVADSTGDELDDMNRNVNVKVQRASQQAGHEPDAEWLP